MAEEFLDLVQWHAGVEQNGRDARSQAVRSDVLVDVAARWAASLINL